MVDTVCPQKYATDFIFTVQIVDNTFIIKNKTFFYK